MVLVNARGNHGVAHRIIAAPFTPTRRDGMPRRSNCANRGDGTSMPRPKSY
jgi:hypothetical protein